MKLGEHRKVQNKQQMTINKAISEIKKQDKLVIPSDKTHTFYKMEPEQYDKVLTELVTANYKKATGD